MLMRKDEPWDMLADKTIWSMLNDVKRPINEEYTRLLFIEIFSRLKTLEHENNTLKVLLFQSGLFDETVFFDALAEVKDFFRQRDEERAREVEFYANLGISFVDWAAFTSQGKFTENTLNN